MLAALRPHALPCLALVFVGAALFGRVLGYEFVRYDDHEFLVQHYGSLVRPSFFLGSFWQDAFAVLGPKSEGVFYRPLLVASYGIEARLGGTDPTLYHATNLALHLVATLLGYALFVAFGASRALAFALAAIFCAHPASTLVAAWIPCRNDSLLAIACVASVLALVSYLRSGRRGLLALCVAAYAAALFTKESGGALLVVLAATVVVEGAGRSPRDLPWAAAALLAATAGWALLRQLALGGSPLGTSNALANLPVLLVYLGKTLVPVGLAPVPDPADTPLWPGLLALGLVALGMAAAGRRLRGVAGLGLVWYLVFLLPAVLVPRSTWGLEHRVYLPLLGMLLFVGQLRAPARWRLPAPLGIAALLLVATLFGVASALRLPHFSGPIPYWENAARKSPHSALAASRVAWRYYEADRLGDFGAAVERALALDDEQADMYLLRGIVAARRGDFRGAEPDLSRAVELDPDNPVAWDNLARLQQALGRERESRESLRRAEALRAAAG